MSKTSVGGLAADCDLVALQNLVPRNHTEQNGTHPAGLTEDQRQKMAAEDDDDDDPESLISKSSA